MRRVWICFAVVIALAWPCAAQQTTGNISGRVLDEQIGRAHV